MHDLPERLETVERVYAVVDLQSRAVKLGRSRNHPRSRLASFQTGCANELYLCGYTLDLTEKEVHHRLWRHKRRGEWFELCAEVVGFIAGFTWVDGVILRAALAAAVSRDEVLG